MEDEQIIYESAYKGYDICVYKLANKPDNMFNLIVADPTTNSEIYTLRFVMRDEAVTIARAFVEGVLYGLNKKDVK